MSRTTMATTTKSTAVITATDHAFPALPTFQAPTHSVEQVLILDHVATLLHLLAPHHVGNGDNDSVDVIDDGDIVARINELMEWYTAYC